MRLKIFGLVVFMFSIVTLLFGQDYLVREGELDLIPDDTSKVNLLIDLGHHYCSNDNEKAVFYLQEALALSNKMNYQKGIIFSYLWQGRVYYYKDEYDLAKAYFEKAKILLEENNDPEALVLYNFASASINKLTGDYLSALKNNQELIRLCQITGDKLMLSAGLHGMGGIHISRNEPDKALPYLHEALAVKDQIDDEGGEANVFTNIGYAWELMGNYDSAMYYYYKGFAIRKKNGNIRRLANSEVYIGSLMIKMHRYDEAIAALKSAVNYYLILDEKTGLCNTNLNLALALNFLGQKTKAMNLAEESLTSAKALQNPIMESRCYEIMAEMADHNKQYNKAYDWTLRYSRQKIGCFSQIFLKWTKNRLFFLPYSPTL